VTAHRRHKKVLDFVKGHSNSRGRLYKTAHQEMMKSLMYAYRDRRTRKRDMRALWIVRINAAARANGMPYNRFMSGLSGLGLEIDRKMLAEMAVNNPYEFSVLVARVKGESATARPAPPEPKPEKTPRAAKAPKAEKSETVIAPTTTTEVPAITDEADDEATEAEADGEADSPADETEAETGAETESGAEGEDAEEAK